MLKTLRQFDLQYSDQAQGTLESIVATPSLLSRVIKSQGPGTGGEGWAINTDGSLRYRERVMVPQLVDLREKILRELHCSRFAVHPGGTKMYHDFHRSITRVG